jgi:hypothetical protein
MFVKNDKANLQNISQQKANIGAYLQSNLTGKSQAYSSRGMFGDRCLAFVYDGCNAYICDCIDLIIGLPDNNPYNLTVDRLRTILTSSNQDSVGRNSLIFYFPTLEFNPALSNNNDDDEE